MKKLISTLLLSISLVLPATSVQVARAEKRPLNACGCSGEGDYCICEKKAKCGCPGECEPKGCEVERQKQLQKEIEAETKRAKEEEKARSKPKDQAKSEADTSDSAASDKGEKKPPVRAMTAKEKKQFLKLLEAYLAEHPEAANMMLSEVRSGLLL
ncbi:MAG TPA: hypothetical protein VF550_17590 [Polyangia bacterium]